MSNGGNGVVKEHTRAGKAHHPADFFASGGGIAVDWTALAGRLPVAMGTLAEAPTRIFKEFATLGTQLLGRVMIQAAIEPNHLGDSQFFTFNSLHFRPQMYEKIRAQTTCKATFGAKLF